MSSGSDMDAGSDNDMDVTTPITCDEGTEGVLAVASSESAVPSSTSLNGAEAREITMADPRCMNCTERYDGNLTTPVPGSKCGHVQCSSCWRGGSCFKCNKDSASLHEAFSIMSPRDLLSPEPQDIAGNGNGDFMDKGTTAQGLVGASMSSNSQATGTVAPTAQTGVNLTPAVQGLVGASMSSTSQATGTVAPTAQTSANLTSSLKEPKKKMLKSRPHPGAQISGKVTETADSKIANIKVNCINGTKVETKVDVSTTKVQDVKRIVQQNSGISVERQHLLFNGKTMSDNQNLQSYAVRDGSTLQMGNKCYGG